MNAVFSNLPVSVFEVMSRLAREQDAVNLGQGFPDDPGPLDVRQKAADAVINGWNQYPPMLGLPDVSALNDHLVAEMQKRMDANMAALAPEELMKNWMAFGAGAQEQFRKLMDVGLSNAAPKG